jgi:hypothetical protein
MAQVQAPILRFNFNQTIMAQIAYFAKLHQFEDRQTYKANWNRWFLENHISLETEIQRLTATGYVGDVKEKMYKAGRYYFRKKNDEEEEEEEEEDKTSGEANKKYITMTKGLLEEMDKHIYTSMQNDRTYTPAKGYTAFCAHYTALLVTEATRLSLTMKLNDEQIATKLKKTYKNRYFIVTR